MFGSESSKMGKSFFLRGVFSSSRSLGFQNRQQNRGQQNRGQSTFSTIRVGNIKYLREGGEGA